MVSLLRMSDQRHEEVRVWRELTGKTHCPGNEGHHQGRIEDLVCSFVLVPDVFDSFLVLGFLLWGEESHEFGGHLLEALETVGSEDDIHLGLDVAIGGVDPIEAVEDFGLELSDVAGELNHAVAAVLVVCGPCTG